MTNIIIAGKVLINGSLTFICIDIAPNIKIASINKAPKPTVANKPDTNKEISKIIAIEIFKKPTVYINHTGKPYTANSSLIFCAPDPRYFVARPERTSQTFNKPKAIKI